MPISKRLAMTEERLIDLMMNTWNMRIATIGPGMEINLTPMWFGWAEGKIFTYGRGQKVVNVRRNPVCSIIVDRNERFPELQAAMFQGRARVLETSAEEQAENGQPPQFSVALPEYVNELKASYQWEIGTCLHTSRGDNGDLGLNCYGPRGALHNLLHR